MKKVRNKAKNTEGNRYRYLSEEEKEKKREHAPNYHKNENKKNSA